MPITQFFTTESRGCLELFFGADIEVLSMQALATRFRWAAGTDELYYIGCAYGVIVRNNADAAHYYHCGVDRLTSEPNGLAQLAEQVQVGQTLIFETRHKTLQDLKNVPVANPFLKTFGVRMIDDGCYPIFKLHNNLVCIKPSDVFLMWMSGVPSEDLRHFAHLESVNLSAWTRLFHYDAVEDFLLLPQNLDLPCTSAIKPREYVRLWDEYVKSKP